MYTYKPKFKLTSVVEAICFDPRDNLSKYKHFHSRENPLYIVDLVTPANMFTTIASCYAIDPGSLKHYSGTKHTEYDAGGLTKAHHYIKEIENPYGKRPKSKLAKAANKIYKRNPKSYIKNIVDPPIFSSIISQGKDTFSHKQERVIIQRTQSRRTVTGGYKNQGHVIPGKPTGIQIGLSNLLPLRKFTPKKDILKQLEIQTNSILGLYLGF